MQYKTVSDSNFESIDFVPTIIIAFYRSSQKRAFEEEYELLHANYPDAEIRDTWLQQQWEYCR